MSEPLNLTHLVRLPAQAVARPPLLILLHGVGSNENDLFTLVDQFDPRLLVLSVRAPNVRSANSYAWFAVTFTPHGPVIDPAQAEQSRLMLLDLIDGAVHAYNADPAQVYLLGFSQGAIMSASVALTAPERVAGAVLLSGRILPEIHSIIAAPGHLHHLRFLVTHGANDEVLPIHHGRASRDLLSTLPVQLRYREHPGGHSISAAVLEDVGQWIGEGLR